MQARASPEQPETCNTPAAQPWASLPKPPGTLQLQHLLFFLPVGSDGLAGKEEFLLGARRMLLTTRLLMCALWDDEFTLLQDGGPLVCHQANLSASVEVILPGE